MTEGLNALRILIVDDNPQMRTIIGAILAAADARLIHYAQHGGHGLEVMEAFTPDVVFVDYEMPVMNGLDFVRAVRQMPGQARFTPLIMLTGHSDMTRLALARDRGVTEFVAKPVSAKTVLGRLSHVISHPRPFIECKTYFGPERRRLKAKDYAGPLRRAGDARTLAI